MLLIFLTLFERKDEGIVSLANSEPEVKVASEDLDLNLNLPLSQHAASNK